MHENIIGKSTKEFLYAVVKHLKKSANEPSKPIIIKEIPNTNADPLFMIPVRNCNL